MNSSIFSDYSKRIPRRFNGKAVCPNCSKVTRHLIRESVVGADIIEPIYLIERINKKINKVFLGCPNFPKCTYSEMSAADKKLAHVLKEIRASYCFDYEDSCRPY